MENPKKVTGIGGVFFRTANPEAMKAWYAEHLGFDTGEYGTNFQWVQTDGQPGYTQWSPMPADTDYIGPPEQQVMMNYRVQNLEALLSQLRDAGVAIFKEIERYDYGTFAQIIDLDGNRVELWEPNDIEYDKIVEGRTKS